MLKTQVVARDCAGFNIASVMVDKAKQKKSITTTKTIHHICVSNLQQWRIRKKKTLLVSLLNRVDQIECRESVRMDFNLTIIKMDIYQIYQSNFIIWFNFVIFTQFYNVSAKKLY